MYKAPIPEVGASYKYLDDGKDRPSRVFGVAVTDVVGFSMTPHPIIHSWETERAAIPINCPGVYLPTTDVFVHGIVERGPDAGTSLIFARSHSGWFSFNNPYVEGALTSTKIESPMFPHKIDLYLKSAFRADFDEIHGLSTYADDSSIRIDAEIERVPHSPDMFHSFTKTPVGTVNRTKRKKRKKRNR